MSMLLKEMRATLGEEGLFGSDNGDAYGAMFDMFLGQHLANQNSLGIAQALNRYMQNANAMDGSPETAQ
jgi:flagellar protein FlgJ